MTTYQGSLLISATADVIDAVFDVSEDRLEVRSGDERLGSWLLPELQIEQRGNAVHLNLDGEDVVVSVRDLDSFVEAVNPPRRKRSKHSKRRSSPAANVADATPRKRREPVDIKSLLSRLAGAKSLLSAENWRTWLSDSSVRWAIASAGVVVFALLALFATNTLGMLLILFGMILLIVAALVVSDDLSAYSWIPGNISESTVVVVGAAAMAIGGVLILIG